MSHSICSRLSTTLLVLLLWPVENLQAAPPEGYGFVSLTEASQRASREGKPIFLYFGRYGCSVCRKMHAEVFSNAALGKRMNAGFVLAYVDTESGDRITLASGEVVTEMQFATRNRILGTPTFIYFSHQQKPLFQKAGFQSIAQMTQYADYILDDHYRSLPLSEFAATQ